MEKKIQIQASDIVNILADGPERGRYAKVLRTGIDPYGKAIYTLKINHYWNSVDNIKRHGPWKGQMWIAIVLSSDEIQQKKRRYTKRIHLN
ncbi:hypothetical protein [Paenibacillus sp. FSL R5-0914]|uniref:hypothetical protein n=1 Tax=Paenibacillus sp. FSL R5-0914 TaxID=2921665 RepID=UPI0030F5D0A6